MLTHIDIAEVFLLYAGISKQCVNTSQIHCHTLQNLQNSWIIEAGLMHCQHEQELTIVVRSTAKQLSLSPLNITLPSDPPLNHNAPPAAHNSARQKSAMESMKIGWIFGLNTCFFTNTDTMMVKVPIKLAI